MLSTSENSRPKSISELNEKDKKELGSVQDFLEENRFRTYNIKDVKTARAYLPQAVIREFKDGFEASTKSPSTSKSRNFVRKLVATLESRKEQGSGHCTADDEFLTQRFSRPAPNNKSSRENQERKRNLEIENVNNLNYSVDENGKKKDLDMPVKRAEQNLSIDEFLKICSLRNSHDANEIDFLKDKIGIYSSKDLENIEEEKVNLKILDFHQNSYQTNSEGGFPFQFNKTTNETNIYAEPKNKKNHFRRSRPLEEKMSFKNILSSIIGLKNRKMPLPRGKRNGLSAKDSLGEEMRLFRRDMMPALMKAARPYSNDFQDVPKDETLSSMIAASKPKSVDRSASIHPFYGAKKTAPKFLQTLEEDNFESQNTSSEENYDFQRQEIKGMALRGKSPPLYKSPPEVVYDVPTSRSFVNPVSDLIRDRNLLYYENSSIFPENNWKRNSKPIPRKNIICGKRALYIRRKKLETQC